MATACATVGIFFSRAKVREWLEELESYSLVKVDRKKDRETRVMLSVSSKDVFECSTQHEKLAGACHPQKSS